MPDETYADVGRGPDGERRHARSRSAVRSTYACFAGRTAIQRAYESGSLRLRHPRSNGCQAVLVNTAGGVVAGDALDVDLVVGPRASVTFTSAAAEKIYRSDGSQTQIAAKLTLGRGSHAAWIPQETIVFGGACLRRRFEIDMAEDASLAAAEIVVFGRSTFGERHLVGEFRDSWRVRRAGRLVFADETRLAGTIGAILGRPAVANGGGAVALVLLASRDVTHRVDAVRAAINAACESPFVQAGASLKDGIIIARFVADAGERLRQTVSHVLAVGGGIVVPRIWQ